MNPNAPNFPNDPNDVPIDIELNDIVTPNKFIEELYMLVREKCNRFDVYPDDFLYQAIPVRLDNGELVWWFSSTHPIVLMLRENLIAPCGQHFGPLGKIEIYADCEVVMCRDSMVGMCNEFGFLVQKQRE